MKIKDKIISIKLSDIKPYCNNVKVHSQEQIERIKKSIEKNGYIQSIMIDKNKTIIIGHGRFEALKQINPDMEIEVIDGSYLKKVDVRKLRINDNKLNESDWNFDNLSKEIEDLYKDSNFEDVINEIGFDDDYIKNIINGRETGIYCDIIKGGDGINDLVGYDLGSVWIGEANQTHELYKLQINLPKDKKQLNLLHTGYTRSNLFQMERIIKTYMRKGDYFLENCCGWCTFSVMAKYYLYSGEAIDIWDMAINHSIKQIRMIKNKAKVNIKKMDGMNTDYKNNTFDFIYCNLPFIDEEKYSGLKNDIANKDNFRSNVDMLMKENFRILKNNSLCVIIINDKREKGYLVALHLDIIQSGVNAGLKLWDFVIFKNFGCKGKIMRKRDYKLKRTVKEHEYIIVFKKI